eukprot:jgi/Botrbrau1/1685/Bobra.116_2s0028.1
MTTRSQPTIEHPGRLIFQPRSALLCSIQHVIYHGVFSRDTNHEDNQGCPLATVTAGLDAVGTVSRQLKDGVNQQLSNAHRALGDAFTRQRDCGSLRMNARVKRRPNTVIFPRSAPFGALIPGDSAVELVLTSGISNFLKHLQYSHHRQDHPNLVPQSSPSHCRPAHLQYATRTLNLFRGNHSTPGRHLGPVAYFGLHCAGPVLKHGGGTACEVGPDGKPLPRRAHKAPSLARYWQERKARREARLGIEAASV